MLVMTLVYGKSFTPVAIYLVLHKAISGTSQHLYDLSFAHAFTSERIYKLVYTPTGIYALFKDSNIIWCAIFFDHVYGLFSAVISCHLVHLE